MDSWVLLVVVVVVVVKRGSGPVSGIGSTRSFLGCIWVVFVCMSAVLAISCKQKHWKRKVDISSEGKNCQHLHFKFSR